MSDKAKKTESPDVREEADDKDGGDGGSEVDQSKSVVAEVLKNPGVLEAVQDRLGALVGMSSGYIENLPEPVKRRVKALKNLQVECLKVEAKFYEEIHALECKYQSKYRPHYEKRAAIVNGRYEPTDEECEWADEEEEEEGEEKQDKSKAEAEANLSVVPEDAKGIPEFWFTTMKNVENLSQQIQEHDEPVLRHLTSVEMEYTENPAGFMLKFHFDPNDFFTDTVLTKTYEVKAEVNSEHPFSFEGPEVVKSTGCKINWKKGKNVTVKVTKKKQKHKGHGQSRVLSKQVNVDSFFNFFSPPEAPTGDEEGEPEVLDKLTFDYELGLFFRDRLIPRAVLYFTGEAADEDDDEFDEEEMDEEDEEGEEGQDPDYKPGDNNKPQECKQQ